MSWARVDDGLFEHPKFADLSDRAKLLFITSLVYGNKHLTDGEIPPSGLRLVKAWANATKSHVDELVAVGLWHLTIGGHVVHDWADYNVPAAKAKAHQWAARERMRRLRSGEHAGEQNGEHSIEQDDELPPARSGDSHSHSHITTTHPIPSTSGGGRARARKPRKTKS